MHPPPERNPGSAPVYSVQTWELTTKELAKIEVVWNRFLRKMVKGGYKRQSEDVGNKNDDEKQEWKFKYSNSDLQHITGTKSIKSICISHQLKYISHICRMDNADIRRQLLFDEWSPKWTRLEKLFGMDAQQIRRQMMDRENFKRFTMNEPLGDYSL